MIKFPSTPWEEYEIDGRTINVKREDLCCEPPGPTFSKIRGVAERLSKVDKGTVIGVMDTRHSMAGWAVAYIGKQLGLQVLDFYPQLKGDNGKLRDNQKMAKSLGAWLFPMEAGMSAVLFNRAKKILNMNYPGYSLMMPNGLKLQESVDATAEELCTTPRKLLVDGTWVIAISSGTLAAGVIKGLDTHNYMGKIVLHMGYSRSEDKVRQYVGSMAGYYNPRLIIVDEGYEYKDSVDNDWIPFPCNEFYDAKAFTWLARNVQNLKPPIVFWNIGS
jgi:hypothetical protein